MNDQGSVGIAEQVTVEKYDGDPLDGVLLETVTIDAQTGHVQVTRGDVVEHYDSPEAYAAARDDDA